jgi:hypothetical protein
VISRCRHRVREADVAQASDDSLSNHIDASPEIARAVRELLFEMIDELLSVSLAPRRRIPP